MTTEERTQKINILVARLREEKKTYREQKKELRDCYRKTIREIKSEIRQLSREYKKELSKKWTIRSTLDNALLSYYDGCTEKATQIRYRIEEPENYEADKLVENVSKYLDKLEKKKTTTTLTEKDISFLMDTHQALKVIERKSLGRRTSSLLDTINRVEQLMPDPEVFKQLQGALNKLEDMFNSVNPQPVSV